MTDLHQLRERRAAILGLAKKYGISRVRVFGSLARGQAVVGSDVDLLVDFEPGRSLLDLVGFEQEVEALLGGSVVVVAEGGISPYMEDGILRDAVAL